MRTIIIIDFKNAIKKLNPHMPCYSVEHSGGSLLVTKQHIGNMGRPVSVTIPKKVPVSPDVIGLLAGEGYFGNHSMVFANSNEIAVKKVLKFFKQFKLPIKAYLEISTGGTPEGFVEDCESFWKHNIDVPINRVRLRHEFRNTSKQGTIHFIINNSLLSRVMKITIEESKRRIEKNKRLSVEYLKGIIAAEGNVNVKKTTGCVYMVRISAKKASERSHYKKCLRAAGIKTYCSDMPTISAEEGMKMGWKTTKGRAGAVIISRWENFIRISELGLFDLSYEKKTLFYRNLVNNMFTQQFLSFSQFIGKKFTAREAQEVLHLTGRHVNRLLTLYRQGYVDRKLVGKHHIYWLNKRYEKIYKLLASNKEVIPAS